MRKWIRPLGALALVALVCVDPARAALSAFEALGAWARQVVPSLLPFLIAIPALCCDEAQALFGRAAGGLMRLLRCPEGFAPAWLAGLLSGSPAGAAAVAACARDWGDKTLLRCAVVASGASPAFLLSAVGAGMLQSPQAGWMLVGAQIMACLSVGLLMRGLPDERRVGPGRRGGQAAPVMLGAVRTLLVIGGYMALFSIIAGQLAGLLGPGWDGPLRMLLELGGGCQAAAALPLAWPEKLALTAAVACLGGASVCAQSLSFLRPLGVKPGAYLFWKLVQAGLSALYALLMAAYCPALTLAAVSGDLPVAILCVALMGAGLALALRRRSPLGVRLEDERRRQAEHHRRGDARRGADQSARDRAQQAV